MRRLALLGVILAIALVGGVLLLTAGKEEAEPWPELKELRLFISPDNGTKTVRFDVCGLKILGKGKFFKAGEELWLPIKDIEDLPEDLKKDYSEPARGKASFTPDSDGYVFSIVILPTKGYGVADTSIVLQFNKTLKVSARATEVSMREVSARGKRYVVYFVEVYHVGENNATLVIICGGDREQVLDKAKQIYEKFRS
ncbi:hypothetical protein [Pyrobaculum aerophilum]|uniref:hypothetical protein n=1 Tax=Pyrobaculum aerophilum TaxID=13773 RepID=UPI002FDAD18E